MFLKAWVEKVEISFRKFSNEIEENFIMTFPIPWQAKAQNDEIITVMMPPTQKLNVM